jgi:hypothetical protein
MNSNTLKSKIDTSFYWMVTDFMMYELDNFEKMTLSFENGKGIVERLIKFHEKLENFEICKKILLYKSQMPNV